VIAGRLGGRRLVAPTGHDTRPTSDRVREALFAVLGDLSGAIVLDLYAGTGSLGIEALSRGAARAVFVERARPALDALRKNLGSLALEEESTVIAASIGRVVGDLGRYGPFDLVLADPPYASVSSRTAGKQKKRAAPDDVVEVLATLCRSGAIAATARTVVEHAARDAAPSVPGLTIEGTRTYGDTALTFYACGPS
jgi:16S rRNA (guanine966-N2)-methyltransferase